MMEDKCVRGAARHIVIAADHNPSKFPGQMDHLVGIRAVSNNVTKVPGDVVLRDRGKNRFESWQIRMDVGDDKRAHVNFTFVFWLCFCP